MAGAIAGTALVNYSPELTDRLSTVTLTVNNLCNLNCPHCYLQYDGDEGKYISEKVLDCLYQAEFKHLVIVGKEPFVNDISINSIYNLCTRIKRNGTTIGVITNGLNLNKVSLDLINHFDYIDVSFDGGKESYEKYRRGYYQRIINHIKSLQKESPGTTFNALHVLNNYTIHNIDDMISVKEFADFKNIMFSPYLETNNDGKNYVDKVKINNILSALARNKRFMHTKNAFLLLDVYHLLGDFDSPGYYSQFDLPPNLNEIKDLVKVMNLKDKVKFIEKDPLKHGFLRLTYDGFILSPYDSLNPSEYKINGQTIDSISINEFFRDQIQKSSKTLLNVY